MTWNRQTSWAFSLLYWGMGFSSSQSLPAVTVPRRLFFLSGEESLSQTLKLVSAFWNENGQTSLTFSLLFCSLGIWSSLPLFLRALLHQGMKVGSAVQSVKLFSIVWPQKCRRPWPSLCYPVSWDFDPSHNCSQRALLVQRWVVLATDSKATFCCVIWNRADILGLLSACYLSSWDFNPLCLCLVRALLHQRVLFHQKSLLRQRWAVPLTDSKGDFSCVSWNMAHILGLLTAHCCLMFWSFLHCPWQVVPYQRWAVLLIYNKSQISEATGLYFVAMLIF